MTKSARRETISAALDALPRGAWQRCPDCGAVVHNRKLAERQGVCLECGSYFRLGAHARVASLIDEGTFVEQHAGLSAADPLEFTDKIDYPTRITRARSASGLADAVITGTARLGGHPVSIAVLDFHFLGGSMGSVVGEKVTLAAEQALASSMPLIVVSASGGARMQEGVLSLLQMAKTAASLYRLREARVPFFSVLTDPVYGGVAASFASLGDIIVAEEGTRAGFAGPQVIEQTIRQKLPQGFQTAQFLLEHGHIDRVVPRGDVRGLLQGLVACHAAAGRPQHGRRGTAPLRAGRDRRVPGRSAGQDRGPADGPAIRRGDLHRLRRTARRPHRRRRHRDRRRPGLARPHAGHGAGNRQGR
jgi:acetyl-CoA carboxylase carboxyl transferase subunit beta